MDTAFLAKLREAGLDPDLETLSIAVPEGDTSSQGDAPGMLVIGAENQVHIVPRPLSALFTGTRSPPSFKGAPPDEYLPFFHTLELAAADACLVRGRPETDAELERLFRHLRRRPDGTDKNPLFGCLQRAAQLYLSLHDVSAAEFEAVVDRLGRSARTFHTHVGSTNYFKHALLPLLQAG